MIVRILLSRALGPLIATGVAGALIMGFWNAAKIYGKQEVEIERAEKKQQAVKKAKKVKRKVRNSSDDALIDGILRRD